MKKFLVLFVMACVFFSCAEKKVLNQLKFDEKANSDILYGFCDLNGLQTPPFNEWFDFEFQEYQPDKDILANIQNNNRLSDVSITIVMGTWCSDSRREVPRFFKIIEDLDYDVNSIKIINVDTKKQANGTPVAELNIERVPTIIFSRGGVDIGRIIESPQESLESDMLKLLSNE